MEVQEQQQKTNPQGSFSVISRAVTQDKEGMTDTYRELLHLQEEVRKSLIAFLYSGYEEKYIDYQARRVSYPDPANPNRLKQTIEYVPVQRVRFMPFDPNNHHPLTNDVGTEELSNFVTSHISPEQSSTYFSKEANIAKAANIIAKLAMRMLVLEDARYDFEVDPVITASFGALVFKKVFAVGSRSIGGFFYKGFAESHIVHRTEGDEGMNLTSGMEKKKGIVAQFLRS